MMAEIMSLNAAVPETDRYSVARAGSTHCIPSAVVHKISRQERRLTPTGLTPDVADQLIALCALKSGRMSVMCTGHHRAIHPGLTGWSGGST